MSRLRVSFTKLPQFDPNLCHIWLDGDILVYTLGFAVEESIEWPDGRTDIIGDLPLAKRLLDNRIRYFVSSLPEGMGLNLVITGDAPNWRKQIDTTYKAGRGRKPTDYAGIREYMRNLPIVHETTDGQEADDWLAQQAGDPTVAICSFDKDFFTVPGTFIHLSNNSSARLYRIEPTQALCFLMFQALAGDPVDSYAGVSNVGKSKASKMLYLCELKGLTIRQAYLMLKATIRKREKQFKDVRAVDGGRPAKGLWEQFRTCLDLASLVLPGETPTRGIGLRRVAKHRHQPFVYFLPYYDPLHTYEYTKLKL